MQVLLLIAIAALWHCPQCSAMRRRTEKGISYQFYGGARESALTIRNRIHFLVAMNTFAATVAPLDELGEEKGLVDFYLAPSVEQPSITMSMFTDILQACDQVIGLRNELAIGEPIFLSDRLFPIFANYLTQLDAMLHLPVWSADGLLARFEPYILRSKGLVKRKPKDSVPDLIRWETKARVEIRTKSTEETEFSLNGRPHPCGATLNKPHALQAFTSLFNSLVVHEVKYDPRGGADCGHLGNFALKQMAESFQMLVHFTNPLKEMKKSMDKHMQRIRKLHQLHVYRHGQTYAQSFSRPLRSRAKIMRRRQGQLQKQLDDLLLHEDQKTTRYDAMLEQTWERLEETKQMAEEIGCKFVFSEKCPNSLFKKTSRRPSDMEFPCAGTLSKYLCCDAKKIKEMTNVINAHSKEAAGGAAEGCSERGLSKPLDIIGEADDEEYDI